MGAFMLDSDREFFLIIATSTKDDRELLFQLVREEVERLTRLLVAGPETE